MKTDVLRTLHRVHRQLTDLRQRLQRGPKQIQAADAGMAHREAELGQARERSTAARVASDSKQVQLTAGEEKIVELGNKLNTASSNREYQALKEQIAAQEMTNSVLADEILEGMDKLDELKQKIVEAEEVFEQARKRAEEIRAKVTQQEPLIRGDIERLEGELAQCEAELPGDVRDAYNRGVRHRGEDALASVENQHCTGCNTDVQLNVCADIMLGKPMFCKSCGRMLYMPEGESGL